MALTCEQWIDVSLSLSLVSIFCLSVISSLNIEAQPDSINVQNTIVTAPLTVVVPITADVQNAQVCVSAASSGDQSCTQVIVSPELNTYEAVHVDLSDPVSVPAVTTAAPGVSKTIAPGSKRTDDAASTNAHQPPVINIKNTVVTQPLTVMIPIETDAQTAQICVTVISSGSQSCQQVVLDPETGMYTPVNVDLLQSTPVITPQGTTASSPPNQPQSINVEHTEVTAPITVIVPITGDIQNAQICVSAGSSGTQSCTQLIVNPEQTAYTPVSADLTQSEAATVSNTVQQGPAPTSEPTTAATTATEPEPDTPTVTDSQRVPASSTTTPGTTVEPSATDNEQPSSDSQPREESAEQGEDNNSNTGETAPSDGEQESTNEDSSTEE